MEQFNITNQTKRALARQVKDIIVNKNDNMDIAILYVTASGTHDGYFHVVEPTEINKLLRQGECYYNSFRYYKSDGIPTLKEIEDKIFN